jgi:hypothetical protein
VWQSRLAVHLGTKSSAVSVIGPYTKRWLRLRPTTQECLRSTKSIQLFPCALSHSSGILRGLRLVQLAGECIDVIPGFAQLFASRANAIHLVRLRAT